MGYCFKEVTVELVRDSYGHYSSWHCVGFTPTSLSSAIIFADSPNCIAKLHKFIDSLARIRLKICYRDNYKYIYFLVKLISALYSFLTSIIILSTSGNLSHNYFTCSRRLRRGVKSAVVAIDCGQTVISPSRLTMANCGIVSEPFVPNVENISGRRSGLMSKW